MTKDEALKLALEALQKIYIAPEHEEYIQVWWPACEQAITAIKEALAQPEQEPVACVIDGDLYFHHEIDWEDLAYQGHGVELLYTTPPAAQRQWVGLTIEEVNGLARWVDEHAAPFHLEFARAIEAKLKKKNT